MEVGKNPPANAGGTGLNPGLGRLHMPWGIKAWVPQLLSPSTLKPVLRNKRSHRNEEQPLLTTTRESPRKATESEHGQKNPPLLKEKS